MKQLITPLALGALLMTSCGGDSSAAENGEAEGFEVPESVVTPAEADAEAAETITQENADAEFEKLKQDVDG